MSLTGLEDYLLHKMIAPHELDRQHIDHGLDYWENKANLEKILGTRLRISKEKKYPKIERLDAEAAEWARACIAAEQASVFEGAKLDEVEIPVEPKAVDSVPVAVAAAVPEGTPEEAAVMEAHDIIAQGKIFEYIYGVWQKRHHGDNAIGKALLLSVGCQSITNTKGIHVQLCGRGGIGKSDSELQMAALMPQEYLKDDDITPQSLYYVDEESDLIRDGTIVLVDDIVWGDALGQTVKKVTTHFQTGASKITTVDQKTEEKKTKKKLTFWVSSVDSQADEQIRDRFLLINVDESPEHVRGIIEAMQAQDSGQYVDVATLRHEELVCQALIRDLKEHDFGVVVPFATNIRFRGDPRSYRIFSDMVKSFAAFRYMKRTIDDKGRLVAMVEDFEDAKALYEELGGHSRDKYTEAETKVLYAIHSKGQRGATQADIQEILELGAGRVSDILNGRGKQGHGLLHKCPHLVVEEGTRPKRYRLLPSFNPATLYKDLVTLEAVVLELAT